MEQARKQPHPEKNDFALAEEVTLKGGYERRPDLVLYLNGIAVAVIELKRSSVEVADGIRQHITNQEAIFNLPFFPTVQLLFAGNDAQGLRYGTVTSREEFFVQWKAAPLPEGTPLRPGALLDRPLAEYSAVLAPERAGGKHPAQILDIGVLMLALQPLT